MSQFENGGKNYCGLLYINTDVWTGTHEYFVRCYNIRPDSLDYPPDNLDCPLDYPGDPMSCDRLELIICRRGHNNCGL